MEIEYDPIKNAKNIVERGISFELVREFDFDTALEAIDTRNDYGETRIVALGRVGNRVYVLCYKEINGNYIRVISFRKANAREVKIYETR